MLHSFKAFPAAAALALSAVAADAATIAQGGTQATGAVLPAGDTAFVLQSGHQVVQVSNPAYSLAATTPASNWVWDASQQANPITFLFTFTLSGWQVASASLSGLWGVDNFGEVRLNGHKIGELQDYTMNNFITLHAFGTSSYFQSGTNVLSFDLRNETAKEQGPAAFRASVAVDVAAVPLPAAAPLLGGALAAFGALALRRKRAARA